ncbi:MAG: hypothetical protein R2719_05340 [Micropruina sp.]
MQNSTRPGWRTPLVVGLAAALAGGVLGGLIVGRVALQQAATACDAVQVARNVLPAW